MSTVNKTVPISARQYWELGCLCILKGKVEKKPEDFDDYKAVEYYEKIVVALGIINIWRGYNEY